MYKFIKPWLNEGLLLSSGIFSQTHLEKVFLIKNSLSSGTKWVQRRKLLTPAFHFKILEQFVEIFDRQSRHLIRNLQRYDQSDKVEMFPLVTNYALDVICESAMGTEINSQQSFNSEYVSAVKK